MCKVQTVQKRLGLSTFDRISSESRLERTAVLLPDGYSVCLTRTKNRVSSNLKLLEPRFIQKTFSNLEARDMCELENTENAPKQASKSSVATQIQV